MAYTPINWQTGDTITAAKLNKMDNGWSVERTQFFSETVTTTDTGDGYAEGTLAFTGEIPDGELTVSFNGNEYVCTVNGGEFGDTEGYFREYPFYVYYRTDDDTWVIWTAAAGTYTIAADTITTETNDNFKAALGSVSPLPMLCVLNRTTYGEMRAATSAGRLLYFYSSGTLCRFISSFAAEVSSTAVQVYPEPEQHTESYGFEDMGGGTLVFKRYSY